MNLGDLLAPILVTIWMVISVGAYLADGDKETAQLAILWAILIILMANRWGKD